MKSFLQTKEWLAFQKELGHEVWSFNDGKIKANIIKHKLPFGKSYLYIPHGPIIDLANIHSGLKNELKDFIQYLKKLGKENKSIFIKMEPVSDVVIELLFRRGFKKSARSIQPQRSVVMDLTLPEEELLSKMHHKTRYNIKVAEKHGIQIKPGQDVNKFWNLLLKTTKRDKFSSHTKEHYEKLLSFFRDSQIKTDLVIAYHQEKPVAGAIVLIYDNAAYYLHGASDHAFRSMMAPYALHWGIMRYLKENGITFYDFWGIDAKKWPGVTRFKLGFGGKQIEYPGSFDISLSWFWNLMYKIGRKVFGK